MYKCTGIQAIKNPGSEATKENSGKLGRVTYMHLVGT